MDALRMTEETTSPARDTQWAAVLTRDSRQDGEFVYAVSSTGVYCRPSCPSRRPLRKNVRFYETPAQAAADGLRPCLRCRPLETGPDEKIRAVLSLLDRAQGESMPLADLARRAGMSPFHLQRRFKQWVGMSPREYQEALRVRSLKSVLREGRQVTEAIYEAGFSSGSRVYERAGTHLGMTPGEYRQGGRGVEISFAVTETELGLLMVGATDRGLCFVQFGDSHAALHEQLKCEYPQARISPLALPYPQVFEEWMAGLARHLEGDAHASSLPLDVRGTAFQWRVWRYLQTIPAGEVQSYSEVAAGIGASKSTRAVAGACAANHVAMVIPCHRVIRGDGSLGGYRWGLDRKRALLGRERAAGSNRT